MQKWAIVILIIVAVVLIVFGGAVQLALTLLPQNTQNNYLSYIVGFGITYLIVNGAVTAMQWFGKSPLDFLPEKTLREKDPQRFQLTKSRDVDVLLNKAREAKENKEHDWAIAFAEALVQLKPTETRGYRIIGEAHLKMHRPHEAIKYGEELVRMQPLDHNGYQLLGDAYTELMQPHQARKWYEKALERVTPDFRQFVLSDLARTYETLGMAKEAAEAYEEYLALADQNPLADYHAENLAKLKRLQNQAENKN